MIWVIKFAHKKIPCSVNHPAKSSPGVPKPPNVRHGAGYIDRYMYGKVTILCFTWRIIPGLVSGQQTKLVFVPLGSGRSPSKWPTWHSNGGYEPLTGMIFQVYGSLKPKQPSHSLLLKKPWTDPASVLVVTT